MIFWKFLSTRPRAVNLDDLVAPIPFSCQLSGSLRRRNSLEQSRFSNSHCGEVVHRVFVLGPCFKSSESSKEVRPGSIKAFCYASLVAITNAKCGTLIFSHHVDSLDRWAPRHQCHDRTMPWRRSTIDFRNRIHDAETAWADHCWAPCCLRQIPDWVNWPLQPRIGYKMEPFTPNRRYKSSISIRVRHYHCSCSSSS
jgi:hypothetical protein